MTRSRQAGRCRQAAGWAGALALVAILLGGAVPWGARTQAAKTQRTVPRAAPTGLEIVVLADGADPVAATRDLGVTPVYVYTDVFSGFAAELPASATAAARSSPLVEDISPDPPVSAAAQTLPTGVDRIDADRSDLARIGGPSGHGVDADVAVLDTGIAKHPDLNVRKGKACIGRTPTKDNDGHGTNVAGIIGAKDNDVDVVGVAPGVRLWSVKVLDGRGNGTHASLLCGLDWVYNHRSTIDVVNISVDGPGQDSICNANPLHRAICNIVNKANIPVVVAAGNERQDADGFVPAAYDQVITVSAFGDSDGQPGGDGPTTCNGDQDDTVAFFSNFGADVDIAAPGECMLTTAARSGTGLVQGGGGTSFSAPHVTGAIALYKAAHPKAKAGKVRTWLLTKASRPRDSAVGFTGDPDGIAEPVLYLGPATDRAPTREGARR